MDLEKNGNIVFKTGTDNLPVGMQAYPRQRVLFSKILQYNIKAN